MTAAVPGVQSGRARGWRWPLLGLCLLLAAASVWTAPVPTDSEVFLDDLAAGNVRKASVTCPDDRGLFGLGWRYGDVPTSEEPVLCWLTSFGLTRETSLADVFGYEQARLDVPAGNLLGSDTVATVEATAEELGVQVDVVDEIGVQEWYRLLGEPVRLVLLLVAVTVALVVRPPRHLGRAGTAVVVALTPLLLGVVWWLARAWPWGNGSAGAAGGDRAVFDHGEVAWWRGTLTAVVAVLAVTLAATGLARGVGALLDRGATASPGDWVVAASAVRP